TAGSRQDRGDQPDHGGSHHQRAQIGKPVGESVLAPGERGQFRRQRRGWSGSGRFGQVDHHRGIGGGVGGGGAFVPQFGHHPGQSVGGSVDAQSQGESGVVVGGQDHLFAFDPEVETVG